VKHALLAGLLACALSGLAQGQIVPAPWTGDPLLDATPVLVELPKALEDESLRVSLDIGLPIGVRLQARLGESRFWAEVGVGSWFVVPFASTALRCDMPLFQGRRNLLALRPSISATIIPLREVAYGFGGDMEVVWQHRFGRGLVTDLGFRFGLSAIRTPGDGWASGWWPVPIAAVVLAVQF